MLVAPLSHLTQTILQVGLSTLSHCFAQLFRVSSFKSRQPVLWLQSVPQPPTVKPWRSTKQMVLLKQLAKFHAPILTQEILANLLQLECQTCSRSKLVSNLPLQLDQFQPLRTTQSSANRLPILSLGHHFHSFWIHALLTVAEWWTLVDNMWMSQDSVAPSHYQVTCTTQFSTSRRILSLTKPFTCTFLKQDLLWKIVCVHQWSQLSSVA